MYQRCNTFGIDEAGEYGVPGSSPGRRWKNAA
jgi:hypothetical protein